ncbi:MAG TPA: hypothetical protein VMT00_15360 [Thermoanaerobaculia bacterium]|nr:hypothetical protein [Thermoanaerobaculia bacterium]
MADPIDRWLADRTLSNRAGSKAIHAAGTGIDFTLEMTGFDFDTVWEARRKFRVGDSEIPVARLAHIVSSKAVHAIGYRPNLSRMLCQTIASPHMLRVASATKFGHFPPAPPALVGTKQ